MYHKSRWLSIIALSLLLALIASSPAMAASQVASAVQAETSTDLTMKVAGPIYVQAGGNLTYELTLENLTTGQTFTNIEFFNDLPANTTYVSGGTLLTDSITGAQYVQFTLASLSPGSKRLFTWVARANEDLAVGSTIDNQSFAIAATNPSAVVGYYPCVSTHVEAPGTVVAILKTNGGRDFDVDTDGYQFQNYGNDPPRVASDDLGKDDVFLMFGAAACQSGTTAATCVLSGPAKEWMEAQNGYMKGGHCDGFSASSMRLFQSLPFKGKSTPATFQPGAANTINLNLEQPIENYIAYYWTTQVLPEVSSQKYIAGPVSIVNKLITDFDRTPPLTYALHIFQLPDWKYGHSIAPYGVERVDAGEYRILVYDNNYPKQRTYITVNMTANTWRYVTASSPGQPANIYEGSADSENLQLLPTAARDLPTGQYFKCPFCQAPSANGAAAGVNGGPQKVTVQFDGEGAFAVINDDGLMTCADPNGCQFHNYIPGATVIYFNGGLGKDIPPLVTIPFSTTLDSQFLVIVHGKTGIASTSGSLTVAGPGYTIRVEDINLAPGEQYKIAFSPNGQSFAYTATTDQAAPHLYISYDPISEIDPSIIFGVRGVHLTANTDIYLDIEPLAERVYVQDNAAAQQNYNVDMEFIWPDGQDVTITESLGVPAGMSKIGIDFGAWDGLLEPPIYADDVLQNPNVNHRMMLNNVTGSYDPTPRPNAPRGVYHMNATFTNVTLVQLKDLYFTVADIGAGNVLLNADGSPAGVGGKISIPANALGGDGVLQMNESFTASFDIGLAAAGASRLTLDANGVPYDWTWNAPAPVGTAHNAPFDFVVNGINFYLPLIRH